MYKEIVQYTEKDKAMIKAFRELQKQAKETYDMWDARFNEIATAWREHRNENMEELGGQDSQEFELTDRYYSSLWTMRENLSSSCRILSSDGFEPYLRNIKPIEELRKQEAERLAELAKKKNS